MILIIFGVGLNAWNNIPKQAEPDIDIPISYVSVRYSGISPTDAEKLLVKPLEKQLRSVAGLDKMTSAATEGYASVTLEFLAGEDIDLVLEDVRKAVDDAKPDLPPAADAPKITEISLSLFPILTAAIYGQVPEKLLILAFKPTPVLTACSTQYSLITGNIPGIAASTNDTWLFGDEPN